MPTTPENIDPKRTFTNPAREQSFLDAVLHANNAEMADACRRILAEPPSGRRLSPLAVLHRALSMGTVPPINPQALAAAGFNSLPRKHYRPGHESPTDIARIENHQ